MTHPDTSVHEQSFNPSFVSAMPHSRRNRVARLGAALLLGTTLGLGVAFAHSSTSTASHAHIAHAQTAFVGSSSPKVVGGPGNG